MLARLSSRYLWQKGYIVRKKHYVHIEQDLTNSLVKSIQDNNKLCFRIFLNYNPSVKLTV